jgi:hypothetical protein
MNSMLKGFSKIALGHQSNRLARAVGSNHQMITSPVLKMLSRTKTNASSISSSYSSVTRRFSSNVGSSANDSWMKWQQSLINSSDEGPKKKTRGGKTLRKRAAKDLASSAVSEASSQERLLDAGQGQFPPLRFSDEETERLLAEAYANIPKRAGKRGTRALKRQKVRFHFLRKADKIKKKEKIQHHFAVMEKRSQKVKDIQKMKEISEVDRAADAEYQMKVLEEFVIRTGISNRQS